MGWEGGEGSAMIGREGKLEQDDRQTRRKSVGGRQVGLGGGSEAGSWSNVLENRSPVLCENRIAVETANPRGTSSAKKLSVWRVSFIFMYDHNTNYQFKTYLVVPEEES